MSGKTERRKRQQQKLMDAAWKKHEPQIPALIKPWDEHTDEEKYERTALIEERTNAAMRAVMAEWDAIAGRPFLTPAPTYKQVEHDLIEKRIQEAIDDEEDGEELLNVDDAVDLLSPSPEDMDEISARLKAKNLSIGDKGFYKEILKFIKERATVKAVSQ